jgi:predicted DNA-binding antitoxin AbrB/MazE fold protein
MSLEFAATYENGVLKPDQPLPLKDHERIVVTIRPVVPRVVESYGMIPSPADLDALEFLARSPENDLGEHR